MKSSKKTIVSLLGIALAITFVPTSFAMADDGLSDAAVREQTSSDGFAWQHEVVYDKADYYQEAEFADSEGYGVSAPNPSVDGANLSVLDEVRTSSLSPVYLSSEFKYFNKYESGGNYDQGFSYGDGYHALGAYQFDHRYVLKNFILDCYAYDPDTFSMFAQFKNVSDADFKKSDAIRVNGKFTDLGNALNAAWHDAYKANPTLFAALQDSWAYNSYYVPIENYLAGRGIYISNRADCVRGLCWGLTSLFGQGGVRLFVGGYASAYNWDGEYVSQNWPGCGLRNDMSDIEFVTALCNYVVDNVGVFYAKQPAYHAGWQNRYRNELKDCLGFLGTWERVGDRWKYKKSDGYVTNSWLKLKSVWYWFDSEGYAAQDGFKDINGARYYFDSDCGMSESTWEKVDGAWYYFGPSGAMHIGWLELNDVWRYLGPDGAMFTGWLLDGGLWYYLDPANDGIMATGWLELNGDRRYLNSGGSMRTGWLWDDGAWYYLDPANDGIMAAGWLELNGDRRYLGPDGAMKTGWLWDDGAWYYLDPANDGIAYMGWLRSGGVWRYLGNDGAMKTGWLWDDGAWYYLDPANDGIMATGWLWDDGSWYYLYGSGVMARNCWYGDYYLLDDGRMATDQWIDSYYVGSDGKWIPGYEEAQAGYVYVSSTGSSTRYHSTSGCSNMSSVIVLALDDAKSRGYSACSKCF